MWPDTAYDKHKPSGHCTLLALCTIIPVIGYSRNAFIATMNADLFETKWQLPFTRVSSRIQYKRTSLLWLLHEQMSLSVFFCQPHWRTRQHRIPQLGISLCLVHTADKTRRLLSCRRCELGCETMDTVSTRWYNTCSIPRFVTNRSRTVKNVH